MLFFSFDLGLQGTLRLLRKRAEKPAGLPSEDPSLAGCTIGKKIMCAFEQ
jgi:hypothetical protein